MLQADEILVLDSGIIVERGTHDDLMSLNGLYALMWRQQHQHAAAEDDLVAPL